MFLREEGWRMHRCRRFKRRLQQILPGEITAARQAGTISARQEPGKDIVLLTDNSNVYHALRKGRSSAFLLNCLCRHFLLLELIYRVRFHIRWIPTHLMPADVYTRESSRRELERAATVGRGISSPVDRPTLAVADAAGAVES